MKARPTTSSKKSKSAPNSSAITQSSFPVAGVDQSQQRSIQPTLSLNTAASVSRPANVTALSQSQTSPIYDQSGNNLHVLEQAIAMAGNSSSSGNNGGNTAAKLPPPMSSSSASAHAGPAPASLTRQGGQQLQQQQQLPPPYPTSSSLYQQTPRSIANHPATNGSNEYHQRNTNNLVAGTSSASSSPRLPSVQQQQTHHNGASLDATLNIMPKSSLPYQYGASNYALPQPQSSMPPPHHPAYTYHHQQPTHVQQQQQQQGQLQPSGLNNPHYSNYQSTFLPQLPPPISYPQSQAYHSDGASGSASASYSGGSSSTTNTSNSKSAMLPNVPKALSSPNRIQDSIQANSQSEALESLKFPFLLPKDERSGGRRGLFSLKNIMKPEDVEEVGTIISSSSDPTSGNNDSASGPGRRNSSGSSKNKVYSHEFLLATDPIQANIISQEDASTLFKLYMDEMSVLNCLLDPTIHTHDFVRNRSKFLYCAILSVISRYLNSTTYTQEGQARRLISPVYSYCKQAARAHLKEVLGNVECSLEVIQGLAVLTFHKEPEDEKACLHLYRVSVQISFFVFSSAS